MSPPPPVLVERAQERISFFFSLTKIKKPTRKQPGPASVARQGRLSPAPRRGRPSSRGGDGSFRLAAPAFATRLSVASWLFVGIKGNLPVTREPAVACCGGEEPQEGRDGTGQCRGRRGDPHQPLKLARAGRGPGPGPGPGRRGPEGSGAGGGGHGAARRPALGALGLGAARRQLGAAARRARRRHAAVPRLAGGPQEGTGAGRERDGRGGGKRRLFPAAGGPRGDTRPRRPTARSGSGCA